MVCNKIKRSQCATGDFLMFNVTINSAESDHQITETWKGIGFT